MEEGNPKVADGERIPSAAVKVACVGAGGQDLFAHEPQLPLKCVAAIGSLSR